MSSAERHEQLVALVAAARSHKSLSFEGRLLLKREVDERIRRRLEERGEIDEADRLLFADDPGQLDPGFHRRELDRQRRRGRR